MHFTAEAKCISAASSLEAQRALIHLLDIAAKQRGERRGSRASLDNVLSELELRNAVLLDEVLQN